MQFVDMSGRLYFYDFESGRTVNELVDLIRQLNPSTRPAVPRPPPGSKPRGGRSSEAAASELVGAALDVLGGGGAEGVEGGAAPPARKPRTTMTALLDQVAEREKAAEGDEGGTALDDKTIAEMIAKQLRATFQQMLGSSLSASPRPLAATLDVAMAYGLSIADEPQLLWLADLAISLPLPAGWVQANHPTLQAAFWHNEICHSSQWQHPVDDFIRTTIKMQRSPSSPQAAAMRRSTRPSRIPRKHRGALHRDSHALSNEQQSGERSGSLDVTSGSTNLLSSHEKGRHPMARPSMVVGPTALEPIADE